MIPIQQTTWVFWLKRDSEYVKQTKDKMFGGKYEVIFEKPENDMD